MLHAHVMIRADDRTLQQAPNAFDAVCVNIPVPATTWIDVSMLKVDVCRISFLRFHSNAIRALNVCSMPGFTFWLGTEWGTATSDVVRTLAEHAHTATSASDFGTAMIRRAKQYSMKNDELLEWLNGQIKKAEKAIKGRLQSAETWRSGTDESWDAAADIHPSTAGTIMTKSDRLKVAEREDNIALRYKRDLDMFKAAYEIIAKDTPAGLRSEDAEPDGARGASDNSKTP